MNRKSHIEKMAVALVFAFASTSAMAFEFINQTCSSTNVFAQEKLSIMTHGPLVVISYEDREVDLIYDDIITAIKNVGMINAGERLKSFSLQSHVTPANGGRVLQLRDNPGVLDVTLSKPILAVTVETSDGAEETRTETIAWATATIDQSTTLNASGRSTTILVGRIEMYRSGHHYFAKFKRSFNCEGLN